MHKIDLSRAFRQLKVDPYDFPVLCLEWQGKFYVVGPYAFGHHTGSMVCSRLSDFFNTGQQRSLYYVLRG